MVGLLMGAFTGFVLYCTYDLTNLSFVRDWPLKVTLIDIGWGTFQGLDGRSICVWPESVYELVHSA